MRLKVEKRRRAASTRWGCCRSCCGEGGVRGCRRSCAWRTASAVPALEVTALHDEILHDAVHLAVLVAEALLARGKGDEVGGCLGRSVAVHPKDDPPDGILPVGDVEEHLRGGGTNG